MKTILLAPVLWPNRFQSLFLSRSLFRENRGCSSLFRHTLKSVSLISNYFNSMNDSYSTSAVGLSTPDVHTANIVLSQSNVNDGVPAKGTGDHLDRTAEQHRQSEIFQMKITEVTSISPTVKKLVLITEKRPVSISFKAGQWLDMFIPGVETVGGFSIYSSPMHLQKTGELFLSVKQSDHPPSKWVHEICKEGDEISIRIGGEFFLDTNNPKNAGKSILLLAGGVGINPLASIIAQIQDYRKYIGVYSSRTLLMFSAKSQNELLFQNYFSTVSEEDPTFSAKYYITGNSPNSTQAITGDIKYGRITKSDIVRCLASNLQLCVGFEDINSNIIVYICGPPPMIRDTEEILKSVGITNISYEKWW